MSDAPERKRTRLKNYDYSAPGSYFVTVCTRDKSHLLGRIVGNGACDIPHIALSGYGKVLDGKIAFMAHRYPHISVDKYVIMPNHFHLLITIKEFSGALETAAPYNNELSKFISLLKRYCNREYGKNIWQSSFNDHIVRGDEDYLAIWRYIDENIQKWNFTKGGSL